MDPRYLRTSVKSLCLILLGLTMAFCADSLFLLELPGLDGRMLVLLAIAFLGLPKKECDEPSKFSWKSNINN